MAKKRRFDPAAEVKQLRGKIRGLRERVELWQTLCLIVAAGSGSPLKAGTGTRRKALAALRSKAAEYLEDYVLSHDPVIRRSIEAAEREFRRKGGRPLEDVIRELEIRRGRITRRVRMELMRKSGK